MEYKVEEKSRIEESLEKVKGMCNCSCESVIARIYNDDFDDCVECITKLLNYLAGKKEPVRLSHMEYVILKAIRKNFKWIARDGICNNLYLYGTSKPEKNADKGYWKWENGFIAAVESFNHLFQFVKWEDEEPYSIQELIENYEKENMND